MFVFVPMDKEKPGSSRVFYGDGCSRKHSSGAPDMPVGCSNGTVGTQMRRSIQRTSFRFNLVMQFR
jgi:hypothetical protein